MYAPPLDAMQHLCWFGNLAILVDALTGRVLFVGLYLDEKWQTVTAGDSARIENHGHRCPRKRSAA